MTGTFKTKEKLVPDTSIIIEGILSKKISKKQLKPKLILIHEAVMAELESQANKNKEIGFLGLDEISKLRKISDRLKFKLEFKGSRPGDFEIRHAKSGEIDSVIRKLAFDERATLVTADKVQAIVAKSKGVSVILHEFEIEEKPLEIEKFFDKQTMSVHLKENCLPKAKKGFPGKWKYVSIKKKKMDVEVLRELAKNTVEEARSRRGSFVELERKGSTIVQLVDFRIVITKPPLADGYEITAVKPVKKLALKDYKLSDKLKKRIAEQAEGVLIAGAPGHGKTTFAQALAEHYAKTEKVVKTVEAPRDLSLADDITQYAMSHGTGQEIQDILLLSRPDYTIFDEMRNTGDFRLFSDLRLSGVGMVGVVHATKPIDAIQRFIGRIELGVIPHVIDTVIFIRNGQIERVFSVSMVVKVPSGMFEEDLARPVVVVNDFESGQLEFEIYSFGEETVVIPVKKDTLKPTHALASEAIKQALANYQVKDVEVVSDSRCIVYVPQGEKASIIGKQGKNIEIIEKKLKMHIDVRELVVSASNKNQKKVVNFDVKLNKKNITFILDPEFANKDIDIVVDKEYLLTAKVSKKGIIRLTKENKIGRIVADALNARKLVLRC